MSLCVDESDRVESMTLGSVTGYPDEMTNQVILYFNSNLVDGSSLRPVIIARVSRARRDVETLKKPAIDSKTVCFRR